MYGRRGMPKQNKQEAKVTAEALAVSPSPYGVASSSSPSVGPAEYETAEWKQQVAEHSHHHQNLEGVQAELSSIFQNVPRSTRSNERGFRKEKTVIVDSGDGNEGIKQEHLSNAKSDVCRRVPGKRKRKTSTGTRDSEVCTPRFRVRGQLRTSDCCNSINQQGKLCTESFQRYFENIWSGLSEEKRTSFAYLDCFWFYLYTQNSTKDSVLKWIKKKNIFSKQYTLVPIVLWSHWSLLILCHFGESPESKTRTRCMLLLDSMQMTNPKRLEPTIRKFSLDLHKMEDRLEDKKSIRKIPLLVPKVPQQKNSEECGSYVLYYISLFLENAPKNFSISDGYPYFMKEDWFTPEGLDDFRQKLESIA